MERKRRRRKEGSDRQVLSRARDIQPQLQPVHRILLGWHLTGRYTAALPGRLCRIVLCPTEEKQ